MSAPATPCGTPEWITEVRDVAGASAPLDAVILRAGTFSEVWRLAGDGGPDLILKLHRLDFRAAFATDPDERFRSFAAIFPIAPFFTRASALAAAFRERVPVALPQIVREGVLRDGRWYVVSTRLEGRPWPAMTSRDAPDVPRTSYELGRIARCLHSRAYPAAVPPVGRTWDACRLDAMATLIDHLPDALVPALGGRRELRGIVDRLRGILGHGDDGRTVLVHGDLHPSNVLLDDRDGVRAIVDFDLSVPGSPGMDFRWLGRLHARSFADGYGLPAGAIPAAVWTGNVHALLWDLMGIVVATRFLQMRCTSSALVAWTEALAPRIAAAARVPPDVRESLRSFRPVTAG